MELNIHLAEQSQKGRFNGSALVRQHGQIVLDKGYGAANHATERPNMPETAFQIASISKQFTAAAILLLQEQNRLSVQDSIQTWVPDCPAEWQPITIHHLLTHTSGMGHWRDFPRLSLYMPNTRENLLRIFSKRPLKFPPGGCWAYSSPAYVLLAHIVEQVSGEPYATFLQRRLFQPLDLASTGAGARPPRPEQQAIGYRGEKPLPSFDLETVSIGAGDIWSTTRDLARWDAALTTPGLLLGEASLRTMFAPHATMTDTFAGFPVTNSGYGWFFTDVEGQPIRFHPGDNAGFQAINMYLPEHDTIIILLSNDERSDLTRIARRLLSTLASK